MSRIRDEQRKLDQLTRQSRSMAFGSREITKLDYGALMTSALAYLCTCLFFATGWNPKITGSDI